MTENTSDSGTYPASCHCGNIAYTVTLYPSLSTYRVNVCTCSFCTKSGYMLVYPRRADVLFHLPSPESVVLKDTLGEGEEEVKPDFDWMRESPEGKAKRAREERERGNGEGEKGEGKRRVGFEELGLREYRFGNGVFRHLSCGRCASSIGFDPRGRWEGNDCLGLNARMFKDIEMDKLKYQYFDGKNLL